MKTNNAVPGEWLKLAECPYFVVEKGIVNDRWELSTTPESFTILVVCEGEGTLEWSNAENEHLTLKAGQCYLLPANLGTYTLSGNTTVLRSYLP